MTSYDALEAYIKKLYVSPEVKKELLRLITTMVVDSREEPYRTDFDGKL